MSVKNYVYILSFRHGDWVGGKTQVENGAGGFFWYIDTTEKTFLREVFFNECKAQGFGEGSAVVRLVKVEIPDPYWNFDEITDYIDQELLDVIETCDNPIWEFIYQEGRE